MIPVQDLCVGNWVYDGKKTRWPMFIRGIGEDYVYLDFEGNEGDLWESWPKELQGIPLTEELLKKIGFHYDKDESKSIKVYALRINYGKGRYIKVLVSPEFGGITLHDVTRSKVCSTRWYHSTIHMKYLHELQNFVYTTTKQQLKIEL